MSNYKGTQDRCYDEQDLIELVRAIKFAHPDANIQSVHREITEKVSKTETFEFLSSVTLYDIEMVWKKALEPTSVQSSLPPISEDVIRFYTIGDGSVKRLAESFSLKAAAKAKSEDMGVDNNRYVHCFLDVPADLSGTKPYQALINFNAGQHDNDAEHGGEGAMSSERDIVKIQIAAAIPGYGPMPMLLYNKDRSSRTFIHPSTDSDDGYTRIRTLIEENGVGGVLQGAGKKGYFYAHVPKKLVDGKKVVSIDLSAGMLPVQPW